MAKKKRNDSSSSRVKFDPGGHKVIDWINRLKHTGDSWGEPFALRTWQGKILRAIFDKNGKQKYRKVYIEIPRKQGKTELVAGLVDYLLFGSGRRSHRIYSASGDHKQAALIYDAASAMIRQDQELSEVSTVYKSTKRIEFSHGESFYEALSSEDAEKYGLRPTVVLIDEMWVLPNRGLFNALESAFGATIDPLSIYITTAGWDQTSLCYEWHAYAERVAADPALDPTFLPILFSAPEGSDWREPSTWYAAMPALGDFCQLSFVEDECKKAQNLPSYENQFKQLQLNIWTEQAERWLSVEFWNACSECLGSSDVATYVGMPCYAGLDLGVTGDMSAFWALWPTPDGVKVAGRCWVPKDGKWRDEHRNKDRYELWHKQGILHFTPGNAADHGQIKRDIIEFAEKTPIISLFADRAYATQILNELYNDAAIPVKGIPQGPVTLNEACVALEEMVIAQQIEHGNNPILNWAVANASVKRGTTGLMHPDKSSATERIDALSALINALAAYKADPENRGPSPYDTPGQLFL